MRRSYCLHFGHYKNLIRVNYDQLEISLLLKQQQLDDKSNTFKTSFRKEEHRRTIDVSEHFDIEHDVEYLHSFWDHFMSGNPTNMTY